MKLRNLFTTLALIGLVGAAPAAHAEEVVSQEQIAVDHVFAPKGFDDNDSSELIVSGMLQNLCYRYPKATASVSGNVINVTVTALHVRGASEYCAQMYVPFTEVINVGVLPSGSYTVKVVSQPANRPLETSLGVVAAGTSAVDDFVYANVDWIETFKDSRRVVLHGYNPSDCYDLDSIATISNGKDAYSVLPIMKQVRESCPMKMVPFAYEFQVPSELNVHRILLHTRVLSGKSVNTIFYNVVER